MIKTPELTTLPALTLSPWETPVDHSRDLLILFHDLSQIQPCIEMIYRLEFGMVSQAALAYFQTTLANAPGQSVFLLRLTNLHTYLPIVQWGEMLEVEFYYPIVSTAELPAHATVPYQPVFLRWGYTRPANKVLQNLTRHIDPKKQLLLVNADKLGKYSYRLSPPPRFTSLLNITQLDLNAGSEAPTILTLPHLPQRPLNINLELRPEPRRDERLTRDQGYLESRIAQYQMELEMLRIREDLDPLVRIHIYAESDQQNGRDDAFQALRDFCVRQPPGDLEKYQYQYLNVAFDGQTRTYHLLKASQRGLAHPDLRFPPNHSYSFYRDPNLHNLRLQVFLPMIDDQKRMVLYPSLVLDEANLPMITQALFHTEAGEILDHDDTLLLWPEPWPDGPIMRVRGKDWAPLSEAWGKINLVGWKTAGLREPAQIEVLVAGYLRETETQFTQLHKAGDKLVKEAWETLMAMYEDYAQRHREAQRNLVDAKENITKLDDLLKLIEGFRKKTVQSWQNFVKNVQSFNSKTHKIFDTKKDGNQRLLKELRNSDQTKLKELAAIEARLKKAASSTTVTPEIVEQLQTLSAKLNALATDLEKRDQE